MPLTTAVVFLCSNCKKEYFWQPELARKVVQCGCGDVIQFPADDPSKTVSASVNPYLPTVIDEKEAMRRARAAMKDDAIGITAQMQAAAAAALNGDEPSLPLDPIRDVNVPFAVLTIGLLAMGGALADMADKQGWMRSIIGVGVFTAIELLLVLLGLTIAGKMANIDFGQRKNAIFKLSALYLLPNAVWLILPVFMGDDGVTKVVGAFTCLILYWCGLSYMFRISGWKAAVCIGSIIVVKIAAAVVLMAALAGLLVAASGR
jgi:hypothetical protein